MKHLITLLFSCAVFLVQPLWGQENSKAKWADIEVADVVEEMTLEEKVGQLFMVAAYSKKDESHKAYLEKLVRQYHIGGVIAMQGGPGRQRLMLDRLQKAAKYPLLVGQDAEWGQAMRLDSTYKFPTALTTGAVQNLELIERLGVALASECLKTGVHMSFSPVLDVNTNPKNPIIGARSFGTDPIEVARRGVALTKGLEGHGVLGSGKHFPGHGDTQTDSHKTLPIVQRSTEELQKVEWVPFKEAVNHGISSLMIAHLNIPSLEPSGKPTSLSSKVIQEVLREQWGYDGLVITDALNMKGVSQFAAIGQLEVEAFKAGNDILLFPMNVPKASKALVEAFEKKLLSEDELDKRVCRILKAKHKSQAWGQWELAHSNTLLDSLSSGFPDSKFENDRLTFELIRDAATLLEVGNAQFPINSTEGRYVHLALGTSPKTQVLNEYLDRYAAFDHYTNEHVSIPKNYEAVVVSFHQDPKNPWRRYKLTSNEKKLLKELKNDGCPIYLLHFANPYGLLTFPDFGPNTRTLIMYENNEFAQMLGPQFLFGARSTKGKLPVDLGAIGKAGAGVESKTLGRLSYGLPSEVGADRSILSRIDSIMGYAIKNEATPGGQVLVARKGIVIFDKTYGYHTYDKKQPVKWDHLYDLASVTKITATLPGIMHWYERQPLLLKSNLGQHLPELVGTNKEQLVLEDVLAHQSGLPAWIPYYLRTIESDSSRQYWYVDSEYSKAVKINDSMYLRPEIQDTMYAMLINSELKSKEYRYSDLGYYLFRQMIETRYNEGLDSWVQSTFYSQLGANRLTFNPLESGFTLDQIVPTENDKYWRNDRVHGKVHDMGAAMLGGISGHAGLFSNANSLAKMMQMYANGGYYGGKQYLLPATLQKFTSCAFCELKNRRGLGFDRKQIDEGPGPSCSCASEASFGHTGFTGTMVWMDPEKELVYIFLSNRTYPDMENWKLSKYDIRTNIQEVVYSSLN